MLNKRNYLLPIFTALLAVFLCFVSIAPAFAADEISVVNNVGVGSINITLEDIGYDDGGNEIPFPYESPVLPGDNIRQTVRVTNEANPAWIRMKVDFYTEYDGFTLDDSILTIASDKWLKVGGYWYYTEPLATGQRVDFSEQISISPEWSNDKARKIFTVTYTAEAVQEDNFTPDWNAEDPWFGTIIEVCIRDGAYSIVDGDSLFQVVYKGGAEGMTKTSDDFFEDWGTLMPGDVETGTVEVKNNYAKVVRMYFRTETIADDELLEKLLLTIEKDGTVIYDGPLSGTVSEILLGRYQKGEGCTLTYRLSVPKELNNYYALMKTKTKWIFRAEIEDEEGKTEDTGDSMSFRMYIWGLAGGVILIMMIVILVPIIKEERNEKE